MFGNFYISLNVFFNVVTDLFLYPYCLQNINTKIVEIDQHFQPLVK